MALDPNNISIVHWCPGNEKHKCGYCQQDNCSASDGMWAEQLTVEDYQNLIDRGWRRSGKYCYKQKNKETCCPLYTIRCKALNFKASKSQKKVIKKLNKFLKDGELIKDNSLGNRIEAESDTNFIVRERPSKVEDYMKLIAGGKLITCDIENKDIICDEATTSKESMATTKTETKIYTTSIQSSNSLEISKNSSDIQEKNVKKGAGADPSKPPCKKAKLARLERKQQKKNQNGITIEKQLKNAEKSIEDIFKEISPTDKHKLRITTVSTSVPGAEWERTKDLEFEIYEKYQVAVHNDPPGKNTMHTFTRFLVSSPLKLKLVEMNDDHETYEISWQIFRKYQMTIHNDEESSCTREDFSEFLVSTPLLPVKAKNGEIGFGSFHQQYWLDDKLIAVGVIDILPKCVSSVYFFYDPDYRNLTLGTYGSLREIQFVKELNKSIPELQYYYMGFYIHSCPKMRYKGKLVPSDLLCPETYEWIPIEQCLPKLDLNKYSRFNDEVNGVDKNACTIQDLNNIKILLSDHFCIYKYYKYKLKQADIFRRIGELIGKKCACSLLIVKPD